MELSEDCQPYCTTPGGAIPTQHSLLAQWPQVQVGILKERIERRGFAATGSEELIQQ